MGQGVARGKGVRGGHMGVFSILLLQNNLNPWKKLEASRAQKFWNGYFHILGKFPIVIAVELASQSSPILKHSKHLENLNPL